MTAELNKTIETIVDVRASHPDYKWTKRLRDADDLMWAKALARFGGKNKPTPTPEAATAPKEVGESVVDDPAIRKRHIGRYDNCDVFIVRGANVRKYFVEFIGGGNPMAYPWMPAGEIWVEELESPLDTAFILTHELIEYTRMKYDGQSYEVAHKNANDAEALIRHVAGPDSPPVAEDAIEAFISGIALVEGEDTEFFTSPKPKRTRRPPDPEKPYGWWVHPETSRVNQVHNQGHLLAISKSPETYGVHPDLLKNIEAGKAHHDDAYHQAFHHGWVRVLRGIGGASFTAYSGYGGLSHIHHAVSTLHLHGLGKHLTGPVTVDHFDHTGEGRDHTYEFANHEEFSKSASSPDAAARAHLRTGASSDHAPSFSAYESTEQAVQAEATTARGDDPGPGDPTLRTTTSEPYGVSGDAPGSQKDLVRRIRAKMDVLRGSSNVGATLHDVNASDNKPPSVDKASQAPSLNMPADLR